MTNDLDAIDAHLEQAESLIYEGSAHEHLFYAVRKLAARARSHPAPPPSPSEENGGEASDDAVRCWITEARREAAPDEDAAIPWDELEADATVRAFFWSLARRAHAAGKQHQASADAATIAGLRADLERIHRAIGNRAPHDNLADCIIEWIEEAKNPSPEPII